MMSQVGGGATSVIQHVGNLGLTCGYGTHFTILRALHVVCAVLMPDTPTQLGAKRQS